VEDNFVGVRFGDESNLTLCATRGRIYAQGEEVVVETERGPAFGWVARSPMPIFKPCQKAGARPITRPADDRDLSAHRRQLDMERQAKQFVRERARHLELPMKVSKVEFNLDGRFARVFFTADGRIDFRRLVREVSKRFSARIRMVQVGARDEAALLGGVGICGRDLCCSSWLKEFKPISIQMAKRQKLSLNPSKISGQCGRLLCCLSYENDQYSKPGKKRPAGRSANP
jgi:cell fate regulator YaaT (PSP1 superfamily)